MLQSPTSQQQQKQMDPLHNISREDIISKSAKRKSERDDELKIDVPQAAQTVKRTRISERKGELSKSPKRKLRSSAELLKEEESYKESESKVGNINQRNNNNSNDSVTDDESSCIRSKSARRKIVHEDDEISSEFASSQSSSQMDPLPSQMNEEDDIFYVEKILAERDGPNGKVRHASSALHNWNFQEYLIKWEEYGPLWNSWEPEENLLECKQALKDYLNRKSPTPVVDQNETSSDSEGESEPPGYSWMGKYVRIWKSNYHTFFYGTVDRYEPLRGKMRNMYRIKCTDGRYSWETEPKLQIANEDEVISSQVMKNSKRSLIITLEK